MKKCISKVAALASRATIEQWTRTPELLKSREDKGVRGLTPHIGPILILIPLKLFLDSIEFTRIMLPCASRVSWRRNPKHGRVCRMRNEIALSILFSIFTWINRHQGKEMGWRFNCGSKVEQTKFSFIFWRWFRARGKRWNSDVRIKTDSIGN